MRRTFIALLALVWLGFGATQYAKAENIVVITSTVFAGQQSILNFDSATPSVTNTPRVITGLRPGDILFGIDFRPSNGQLYGVSQNSNIYTINAETGVATFVSTSSMTAQTDRIGFDFDPVTDRLRITGDGGRNISVNVDTGEAIVEGRLAYAPGDPNFRQLPFVTGSAYTNSVPGATSTLLYGVDRLLNVLVIQDPTTGTLRTVGSLGIVTTGLPTPISGSPGFDISGQTGIAYSVLTASGTGTQLYTIDLNTGLATPIGPIGGGIGIGGGFGLAVGGASPIPEPATMILLGTGLAGIAAKVRRRRKGN